MAKLVMLALVGLAYVAVGSAPASAPPDHDHDGLPDRWERRYDLSTSRKSAHRDPDHDGLGNVREFHLRTNPRKRDTDGDGSSDRVEVHAGTNPRNPASRPPPSGDAFPSPATTGVPAGWRPSETRSTNLTVDEPGTVVQDLLLKDGADLLVRAPDVTVRRVKLQGGIITNQVNDGCGTGLLVEDTTFEPVPGTPYTASDVPALGEGGYTARRVEIEKRGEGFRASDCGPVTIEDSFADIKGDDADCTRGFHSDGVQGYFAKGLTLRNATLIFANACGTSPYFIGYGPGYPSQPPINTGYYTVDHLLVSGGGYVFRHQVPGSVTGLRIVNKSWVYGPIDNACSVISPWEAKLVDIDANYQVTRVVRNQPCDTEAHE